LRNYKKKKKPWGPPRTPAW